MEFVKIFFILNCFVSGNIVFSQNSELLISEDLSYYKSVSILDGDTIEHILVSKLVKDRYNDIYSTKQTLGIMFVNDSLLPIVYDVIPINSNEFNISIDDSCKAHDFLLNDRLNNHIAQLIKKLLYKSHEEILIHPKSAKVYFDALQSLALILNNEKLNFVLDYIKYNNFDLPSLEVHYFYNLNKKKNKKNLFYISQAYRMNNYNGLNIIRFDLLWSELLDKYSYFEFNNLFSKKDLRKLNRLIDKNRKVFALEESCWSNYW